MNGGKFSKLDRFLVSHEFRGAWCSLLVFVKARFLSDHCHIILEDKRVYYDLKPFRCFDAWLEEKDMDMVVKDAWSKTVFSKNPDAIFHDRLKNVKLALKEWSKNRFGGIEGEIEDLKVNVTRLEKEAKSRSLNDVELDQWKVARL